MDMKLEVVVIPVSDVDRAKQFYQSLGFRLDVDRVVGEDRVVQFTPPGSFASIHIGKGITTSAPGSAGNMMLSVANVDEAREELKQKGVAVSAVFHPGNGSYHRPATRVAGPDPQRQSYRSFASFNDPDGNPWLLQEITARLPGRGLSMDVATLTELLREIAEHHGQYEKAHAKHNWWDWYAAYINARQQGSTPEDAANSADAYLEKLSAAVSR